MSRLPAPMASALFAGLLLTACGDGGGPDPVPPPVTPSDGGGAASSPEPAVTTAPAAALPLTPGVYVSGGEDCARPANAGVRVYDGRGLSGSATRDCRAAVRSVQGDTYRIDQSCIDTYSGERTTAGLTIRSADPQTFTLTEDGEAAASFRLCPAGAAPSYLEDLVTPD